MIFSSSRLTPRQIVISVALAVATMSLPTYAQQRVILDGVTRLDPNRATSEGNAASFVSAERIEGNPEDKLHLYGNAEIRRGGAVVRGDRMTYTQATDEVEVQGHAHISREGASFSGPSMRFRISSRSGQMSDASWEYAPRRLRGCAKNVRFLSGDRTTFDDVSITTCKRDDDSWFIKLNNLEIDEYEQSATGTGAVLHFKGIPIFGSPWFGFPISKERRSGFLTPTYGMSSSRGVDLSIPYYWNIAPNYDYTFTPRLMTKRGVMLGNEIRAKFPNIAGLIDYQVLPNDRITDTTRYGLHAVTTYQKDKFSAGMNYNRVSDDNYLSDISGNIRESSETVLPQDYWLTYTDLYWNSALRVTKNKTLQVDGITYEKPYERVPQVTWNGYAGNFHGFELHTVLDATRFSHPTKIEGSRFVFHQSASYPFMGAGWFVVPKAQFLGAWYQLDRLQEGYTEKNPSRTMPIFSLDSGLVFERDASWLGRDAFQTLEPRIYYAWAPYRNQADLPIFDSTIADLNFTTLFSENVFSGYDRVSEANQLSTVLSTRYIDKSSGLELFRASVGQRQYFSDQRVQYDYGRGNLQNIYAQNATRTDVRSDLLASVGARLSKSVTSSASAQYSSAQGRFVKINAGIRWQPRPMSLMGLYYRYNYAPDNLDNHIKQVDFAMQWPLTQNLFALFRYNYSLYRNKPIELIGGFEYLADCWSLRAVAQRYTTAENKQESNFFLQLELTGLGSIGTSPISELTRNIKGYQTLSPVPSTTGQYDYYE